MRLEGEPVASVELEGGMMDKQLHRDMVAFVVQPDIVEFVMDIVALPWDKLLGRIVVFVVDRAKGQIAVVVVMEEE
jgi:hypothetical protein